MDGYQHRPADLILADTTYRDGLPPESHTIHSGGRLSRGLLLQLADKIDEWFECQLTGLIEIKLTLTVTPVPRKWKR
jgi:hypothetical protein